MRQHNILLLIGSLAFASGASAEVRLSRGYEVAPGATREAVAQHCYNAECSTHFNSGSPAFVGRATGYARAASVPTFRREGAYRRGHVHHTAQTYSYLPMHHYAVPQRDANYYVRYSPFVGLQEAVVRGVATPFLLDPNSRLNYELGLYPSATYLAAHGYCDKPTLHGGAGLCMGSKWPFYGNFLTPTEHPLFNDG